MKKIFITAGLVASAAAFAQTGKVGINTPGTTGQPATFPEATLDIRPNAANAATAATTVEGVLVPRVSRLRAANMGAAVPESTLIYVNSVADGAASGTTANVDAAGFYYFAGGVWVKMGGGSGGAAQRWESIRTATEAFETITAEDQTIGSNTYFANVSGSTVTKVRLPAVTAGQNIGKTVVIFKSDSNNLTVVDSNNNGPSPTGTLRGTTAITSSRSKTFIWTGAYWAPTSY